MSTLSHFFRLIIMGKLQNCICGKVCGLVWMTYVQSFHIQVCAKEREQERVEGEAEWWKWASPRRGWGSYCNSVPVLHWGCLNHESHITLFFLSGFVGLIVLLYDTNTTVAVAVKHDLLKLIRLDHQPSPVTPGYLCSHTWRHSWNSWLCTYFSAIMSAVRKSQLISTVLSGCRFQVVYRNIERQ